MKRVRREKEEIVKDFIIYTSVGEKGQVVRFIAKASKWRHHEKAK